MRNIKRVLSLVLAMVMLLGMVMIPTGAAANFSDSDMIVNKEAVEITSGIGLFAGSDGKFNPKGLVTRAQMATIIVKMLRGSDFNADAFKGAGVNPFPDTAAFEGGWAEGYINACYQLGVVAGYGDGTFKPGNTLTTAEALTMIINALGVDPGPGEWPMTYMAKAEEMKLYGDLASKPATNSPLSRDQLAVIVWEGLKYSPAGTSGYSVTIDGKTFTFETLAEAIDAVGIANVGAIDEVIGEDALASKIYEVKTSSGWVTGNEATGDDCTVLTRANGDDEYYGIDTDVDLLGHYVTVYYKEQFKNDEEPGEVYTIIDESAVVTVSEAISTTKKYKEVFGKSIEAAANGMMLSNDYTVTEKLSNDLDEAVAGIGYVAGSAAPKGTYIIVDGAIVAYIEPAAVYASYITDISTAEGKESVWINGANGDAAISNAEGDDMIVEYDGMAVGDYITYMIVNGVYVVSPLTKIAGTITKTSTIEVNGENYDAITINGIAYPAFEPQGTVDSRNDLGFKLSGSLSDIVYGQNYTLYVSQDGHYVGFEGSGGEVSVSDTVYLLGSITTKTKDSYGKWTIENKGRGVDMDGNEVLVLLGKQPITAQNDETPAGDLLGSLDSVSAGFYNVKDSTDKDAKKEGIQVLEPFASAYSVDTPTFVTSLRATAGTTFSGAGAVLTRDGLSAYFNAESRFIYVEGELTDSAPIKGTVVMEKITARPQDQYFPMLVTRASSGSYNMTNVLIIREEAEGTREYVYVSADQIENPSQTANGAVYEVYGATDGAVKEVAVSEESELSFTTPGFYAIATDTEGQTKIVAAAPTADTSLELEFYSNLGFTGIMPNGLVRAVGVKADGSPISWPSTSGGNSMKVIDVRSEEEIEASEVPEITSASQLKSLRDNNPSLTVVFDIAVSNPSTSSTNSAKAFYVTRAVRKSPGLNGVVYTAEGPSVDGGQDVNMIAISTTGKATGEIIPMTFEKASASKPGFYRYTPDATGDLTLVAIVPSALTNSDYGFLNVAGVHNLVTAISGSTITTEDFTADECGVACSGGSLEAASEFTVSSETVFVDETGAKITFADLQERFASDPELVINYYCTGSNDRGGNNKDTSAEFVAIHKPVYINHVSEGSALTADTAALGNGIYYLADDVTATGAITVTGEATLCLNGHTLSAPASAAGESFITVSADAKLTICGGVDCRASGSNGTISGTGTTNTRGINVAGTLTLRDATIDGFTTTKDGGGVLVAEKGIFTMNAGTISNNKAANGGGIRNDGGTLTIADDCRIVLNTATGSYGGGIYTSNAGASSSGTKHITSLGACVIAGNNAPNAKGGGIANRQTPITMDGTIIGGTPVEDAGDLSATSGNIAKSGGGFYTAGKQTDNKLKNLTVTGNYATGNGGGIETGSGQAFVNAVITNNRSGANGGGVYAAHGTDFGSSTISGNSANKGGGIYINGNSDTYTEFAIGGGTITNNTATAEGGGIYATTTKTSNSLKFTGGTITGNTAGTKGGGLYVTFGSGKKWVSIDVAGADFSGNTAPENADVRLPS